MPRFSTSLRRSEVRVSKAGRAPPPKRASGRLSPVSIDGCSTILGDGEIPPDAGRFPSAGGGGPDAGPEEAIIRETAPAGSYLRELGTVEDISFAACEVSNDQARRGAPSSAIVEVASDVNGLLLSHGGAVPPDSYYRASSPRGGEGYPQAARAGACPRARASEPHRHKYGE